MSNNPVTYLLSKAWVSAENEFTQIHRAARASVIIIGYDSMAKLAMEFLYHGACLVREHKWEKA